MGRLDHGLQQRSDDVVLTAMGKRAAASASMVVGHEVNWKNQVSRSAHGGGLEGSCLWDGVEEVKKAMDLRFHDWGGGGVESPSGRHRRSSLSLITVHSSVTWQWLLE
jgi:hypothetical protein